MRAVAASTPVDADATSPGVVRETPTKTTRARVASAHDAEARDALVFATETECERYAEATNGTARAASVTCDPFVSGKLREHQRAGARWMYRALHGIGEDEQIRCSRNEERKQHEMKERKQQIREVRKELNDLRDALR